MCKHSTLRTGFVWNELHGEAGTKAAAVRFCFWTIIANLTNHSKQTTMWSPPKKIIAAKEQMSA